MKRSLEDDLIGRRPEVFRGVAKELAEGRARFGCAHGDGWHSLADALSEVLTAHARDLGREPVEAACVKQKYARFTFYAKPREDKFEQGAIWAAEELSGRICEVSGVPGHLFVRGIHLRTLAPDLAAHDQFSLPNASVPPPIPSIPWQQVFDRLDAVALSVLVGPTDVPPGWADIAEFVVDELSGPNHHAEPPTARVLGLGHHDGQLLVEVQNARQTDAGVIAFARAISKRIDPITGVARVPNLG